MQRARERLAQRREQVRVALGRLPHRARAPARPRRRSAPRARAPSARAGAAPPRGRSGGARSARRSSSAKRLTPTIDALARLDLARVAEGRLLDLAPAPSPASIAATAPPSSSIRADQLAGARLELVRQRLDEVRAAERVGGVGRARLVREDLLRAERDPRRALASAARAPRRTPFVCSDCAPPHTAESAWIATRTTLFSGCCAVSVEPPVCAWKRSASAFGFVAPKRSRIISRPQPPRRAELRHLLEEVVVRVEEEREPRAELVGRQARRDRRLAVGDPVRERERELLHRRRARLADVVAGDRDRVPARQPLGAVREEVGRQPHRRAAAGRCSSRARRTP